MNQYQLGWNLINNPGTWQGAVFYGALIIILAWAIGKVSRFFIRTYLVRAEKAGLDATSVLFLAELGRVIVYVVAFLCYASIIPALHSLGTTWLASVGVISLVVGLATQSTLSNVVAGISLILYRPFRLGDRLLINIPGGTDIGIVESIKLGYTVLRTHDGRRVVMPNSLITNQTNVNFSKRNAHVVAEILLTVPQDQDVEKVRTILHDVSQKTANVMQVNGCFATGLGNLGTTLMISVVCVDPGDIAQIRSDILLAAKKQFDSSGVKL